MRSELADSNKVRMDTSQEEISALPSLTALVVGGRGIFVVEPFFPLCSQSPYKFQMFIYKIAGLLILSSRLSPGVILLAGSRSDSVGSRTLKILRGAPRAACFLPLPWGSIISI